MYEAAFNEWTVMKADRSVARVRVAHAHGVTNGLRNQILRPSVGTPRHLDHLTDEEGNYIAITTASESTTVSISVFDAVVSAAVTLLFVLSGRLIATGP